MTRIFRASLLGLLFLAAGLTTNARAAADKAWPIDHMLGKADAPITVIEYASLTCPHCAAFDAQVFPKIKTEWIDTGKVKFIFRDFPLDANAQAAALIAQCSGDRYYAFIDTFFRSQTQWARSDSPLDSLKAIARIGGLSTEAVDRCLNDSALFSQITDRQDDGQKRYRIDSTPSFIINGTLVAGEMSYESFAALLAKAK